jgi:hypothetical protein
VPDEQGPTYGPTDLGRRAVAVIDSNGSPVYSLPYDFLVMAYLCFYLVLYLLAYLQGGRKGLAADRAMFVARRAATEDKGWRGRPADGLEKALNGARLGDRIGLPRQVVHRLAIRYVRLYISLGRT